MKNRKGIIGTVIFHVATALVIVIFGFSTPLPLPDEEGILINFGTDETGSGDIEPAYSEASDQTRPEILPVESAPEPDVEEISTQDYEEAPSLEKETVRQKQEEKKEVIQSEQPEDIVEEAQEEEVQEERKVNDRALYTGRRNTDETSTGEGIAEGEGNQGSITGSTESDNYSDGLSSGSGGTEFSLSGRNPVSLPLPRYEYQIAGKVVVEIKVDRYGNVTSARGGITGSNINDQQLIQAAEEAALKAKFDSKPDAPYSQRGTITYYFILQ